METEAIVPFRPRTSKAAVTSILPEVDVFIHLLLLLRLLDSENMEKVYMHAEIVYICVHFHTHTHIHVYKHTH